MDDSSDQNKLFLVSLGPDPIIRLSVRSDNCWSRDSPDGRERASIKRNRSERKFVRGGDNTVLNSKCSSVCVSVCVVQSASRLKVRSKATVLAGGKAAITPRAADTREK